MEWTSEIIGRLHDLHKRYVECLRSDVVSTNRSLGSLRPDSTKLAPLSPAEFESVLMSPESDPEVVHLWVHRIIRGHERDFPELQAAG